MHRCFVEPALWTHDLLAPCPEEAHHLLNVLRVREGDTVRVFDGHGREAEARIRFEKPAGGKPSSQHIVLVLTGPVRTGPPPTPRLVLMQCLPKGKRMDLIVEKAVELGFAEVMPVMSERVVVLLTPEQQRRRNERWQRIAHQAARQCGALWLLRVHPVRTFPEAVTAIGQMDHAIMGSLDPEAPPLKRIVSSMRPSSTSRTALLIGPEGDLTAGESAAALRAGARSAGFGDRVLRTETAALYGMSVLGYEWLSDAAGSRPAQEARAGS